MRDMVGGWVISGFTALVWILYTIGYLAITAGLFYVAWHFISKFW